MAAAVAAAVAFFQRPSAVALAVLAPVRAVLASTEFLVAVFLRTRLEAALAAALLEAAPALADAVLAANQAWTAVFLDFMRALDWFPWSTVFFLKDYHAALELREVPKLTATLGGVAAEATTAMVARARANLMIVVWKVYYL